MDDECDWTRLCHVGVDKCESTFTVPTCPDRPKTVRRRLHLAPSLSFAR